jgi:hypothetical protein
MGNAVVPLPFRASWQELFDSLTLFSEDFTTPVKKSS